MLSTCFPSGNLEFYVLDRECLCDQLNTHLGHQLSNGLPWRKTTHTYCCNFTARGKVVFTLHFGGGTENKEACRWISPDSACISFSYNPVLHPHYFIVINFNHKYKYWLSPMCSCSKSPNTGMVLGTHNTAAF